MKSVTDENELYCEQRLGISNAKGKLAQRLRELSPEVTEEELLSLPLSRGRFLVVDLETTGMKSDKARIIEIGAVEIDGFGLGKNLDSLIYPGRSVPSFISNLTGISTSMVVKAPRIEEVLPILRRMMKGRVLVAHNLSFDKAFLDQAWESLWDEKIEAPGLCTVRLARRVFPDLNSHNLDSLTSHLHIRPDRDGAKARHRALGDARITAMALVRMNVKLDQEGEVSTVRELIAYQRKRPKKKKAKPKLF